MADKQDPKTAGDDRVTVKLKKPIEAFGDPVGEIAFRAATAADIQACGYPILVGADERVTFDGAIMTRLIARLSELPAGSVATLDAADWQRCATVIGGFFGDAG